MPTSTASSRREGQRWVIEAYKDLSEVRRLIRAMNDSQAVTGAGFSQLVDELGKMLSSLSSHVGSARTPNATRLRQLVDETAEINRQLHPTDAPPDEATVRRNLARLTAQEPRLKRQVTLVRDTAAFSPT
jgi:hypothetical protein